MCLKTILSLVKLASRLIDHGISIFNVMNVPSGQELTNALDAAAHAHHDYESNYLQGARDKNWAGWYASYVLGRLGDFTSPTILATLLEEVTSEEDWVTSAVNHVLKQIS
jgi:hypothetical protein